MHVISRTREQTTAAEPPPARRRRRPRPAFHGSTTSIDAGLDALYRRHTPDVARSGDPGPVLRAAARSHRELAGHRPPGQELIRIRDAHAGGESGARSSRSSPTTCPTSSSPCSRRCGGPGARPGGSSTPSSSWSARRTASCAPSCPTPTRPRRRPARIAESWIHVDLGRPRPRPGLEADVAEVLHDVREVVRDAPAMARQASALGRPAARRRPARRRPLGGPSSVTRADDVANLLRWLADGHFTFLGHRYLTAAGGRLVSRGARARRAAPETAASPRRSPRAAADAPPELLVFTRASAKSRVLRPVQPYYLAVRIVDGDGTARSASTASSACSPSPRSTRTCSTSRSSSGTCATRSTAPASRWSPTRASRCSRSSRRCPARSCSAAPSSSCTTPPSACWPSPAAARSGSSCAPTRTAGSSRAWSTCRATGTRRRRASRWPTCCAAACDGHVRRLHRPAHGVRARARALHRAHRPGRRSPEAVDVDDLQDELAEAIRTWDDRLLSLPGSDEVADLLPGVPEAYKAGGRPGAGAGRPALRRRV